MIEMQDDIILMLHDHLEKQNRNFLAQVHSPHLDEPKCNSANQLILIIFHSAVHVSSIKKIWLVQHYNAS